MYSSAPTEDLHELWRRIVFNVMVGNLDDHLRNHGFLYDRDDKWRLSPAYDLNPVPLTEKARELTTWISRRRAGCRPGSGPRRCTVFRAGPGPGQCHHR